MRIDQLRPAPTAAEALEIPEELLGSVVRHQANLAALIASLQAAGIEDQMVEVSVRTLVDSYAEELTVAVRAMVKAQQHG